MRDARKQAEDSHILQHLIEAHPGANSQELFEFKVLSSHKTSFGRQLGEAVAIMTYRGGTLLNRKEMFNRCLIPSIFIKGPSDKLDKTKKNKYPPKNEEISMQTKRVEQERKLELDELEEHEDSHPTKKRKITSTTENNEHENDKNSDIDHLETAVKDSDNAKEQRIFIKAHRRIKNKTKNNENHKDEAQHIRIDNSIQEKIYLEDCEFILNYEENTLRKRKRKHKNYKISDKSIQKALNLTTRSDPEMTLMPKEDLYKKYPVKVSTRKLHKVRRTIGNNLIAKGRGKMDVGQC